MRKARGDRRGDQNDGSDEDASSSAKVVIERIGEPAPEPSTGEVRCSVNDTFDPFVVEDTELLWETQVGSIASRLVPI